MKKLFKPLLATIALSFIFLSSHSQLCINFYYFNSAKNGSCAVDLEWKYQQCETGKFYVEYSLDASSWKILAIINSTGLGTGTDETYNYTDNYACPGDGTHSNAYYRIRYVRDTNGSTVYSSTNPESMGSSCSCTNNNTNRCNGISSLSISGANAICNSSSQIYTLSNSSYPVTWTITEGYTTISTYVGNYQTTIGNASTNGVTRVLHADIYGCANASKAIVLGSPALTDFSPGIYLNPGDENEICDWDENVFPGTVSPNSTISWTQISAVPGGGISYSDYNYDDFYLFMWKPNQIAVFRFDASNSCGSITYDFGFKAIDCSGRFMISPNPSKGEIHVMPKKGYNIPIDEISVYNLYNNLLFKRKYYKQTTVDISLNLKPGNYFMKIKSGKFTETKHLLIK
jgi:hypothetical protein